MNDKVLEQRLFNGDQRCWAGAIHAWHRKGRPPGPITLTCSGCGLSFEYVLLAEKHDA